MSDLGSSSEESQGGDVVIGVVPDTPVSYFVEVASSDTTSGIISDSDSSSENCSDRDNNGHGNDGNNKDGSSIRREDSRDSSPGGFNESNEERFSISVNIEVYKKIN